MRHGIGAIGSSHFDSHRMGRPDFPSMFSGRTGPFALANSSLVRWVTQVGKDCWFL